MLTILYWCLCSINNLNYSNRDREHEMTDWTVLSFTFPSHSSSVSRQWQSILFYFISGLFWNTRFIYTYTNYTNTITNTITNRYNIQTNIHTNTNSSTTDTIFVKLQPGLTCRASRGLKLIKLLCKSSHPIPPVGKYQTYTNWYYLALPSVNVVTAEIWNLD